MTFQGRSRNRWFMLLAAAVLCLSHAGPASAQDVLGSNVNVLLAWDASDHYITPRGLNVEDKGLILQPKFVFIDGRTGATMYSERYREEILYNAQQNTPALSSYFELMDRLVPNFLSALSSQKIRGTRVLLK